MGSSTLREEAPSAVSRAFFALSSAMAEDEDARGPAESAIIETAQ